MDGVVYATPSKIIMKKSDKSPHEKNMVDVAEAVNSLVESVYVVAEAVVKIIAKNKRPDEILKVLKCKRIHTVVAHKVHDLVNYLSQEIEKEDYK